MAPVADVLADLEWRGLLAQTTDREALARDLAAGPRDAVLRLRPDRRLPARRQPGPAAGAAALPAGRSPADRAGRRGDRLHRRPDGPHRRARAHDGRRGRGAHAAARARRCERFLVFDDSPTGAVLADNLDWTRDLGVLDFLRDVGAHFPVNQMLARESVSARLEGGGLSFTEFSYQLLQSMDYVELHRRYGCRLQVGGNDQWGNITAGLDLLRRVEQRVRPRADLPARHRRLGQQDRQEHGRRQRLARPGHDEPVRAVPVPAQRRRRATPAPTCGCSPSWAARRSRRSTRRRRSGPQARAAQRRLAAELVALVHGPDEVERVQAASAALFGGGRAGGAGRADAARGAGRGAVAACSRGRRARWRELLADGLGLSRSDARRAVAVGRGVPQQRPDHRRGGAARRRGLAARALPGAAQGQADGARRRAGRLSGCRRSGGLPGLDSAPRGS